MGFRVLGFGGLEFRVLAFFWGQCLGYTGIVGILLGRSLHPNLASRSHDMTLRYCFHVTIGVGYLEQGNAVPNMIGRN